MTDIKFVPDLTSEKLRPTDQDLTSEKLRPTEDLGPHDRIKMLQELIESHDQDFLYYTLFTKNVIKSDKTRGEILNSVTDILSDLLVNNERVIRADDDILESLQEETDCDSTDDTNTQSEMTRMLEIADTLDTILQM